MADDAVDSELLAHLGLRLQVTPTTAEIAADCRHRLRVCIETSSPCEDNGTGHTNSAVCSSSFETTPAVVVAVRALVLEISAELDEVRPNAEFAHQRLDELLAEVRTWQHPFDANMQVRQLVPDCLYL